VDLGLKINPVLMTYFVVILTSFKHAHGLVPEDRNKNFKVAKAKVAESM
jgi:hypothetical protein